MKPFVLIYFIISTTICHSQSVGLDKDTMYMNYVNRKIASEDQMKKDLEKNKIKIYTSLVDALKANHDSVLYLFLGDKKLDNFPKELFVFKNLRYLDLKNTCRKEYIDSLSPKERLKYEKLAEKEPRFAGCVYYNANTFTTYPNEMKQMTNLRWVRIGEENICEEEYLNLEKLLPNCYIDTGLYEIKTNDPETKKELDGQKKHCKVKKK